MAKALVCIFLITILLSGLTVFSTISGVKAQNPQTTIIQPENIVYTNRDVPLAVYVNAPPRFLWCSLNGFNFTLEGNTTLKNLQNGNYTLTVFANTAGVTSSQTVLFTVDSVEPIEAPKVTILSPVNQLYNTTQIPLNFTVDQPSYSAVYSIDGQQNQTAFPNTGFSADLGTHTLKVYATSIDGGPAGYDTVTFTVNATGWGRMLPPNLNSTNNYRAAVDTIVQASMQVVTSETFIVTLAIIFGVAIGVLIVFLVVMTKAGQKQKKHGRLVR